MKIGILSMQKIHNYGSFLQALSLKMQMEERGHDVYFIDIEKGREIVPTVGATPMSFIKKVDRYFLKRVENYLFSKKMAKIHTLDHIKHLETEKKLPRGEKFSILRVL